MSVTPRYTRPAAVLHALIAVGVLGLFTLGLYMSDLPLSPQKLKLYSYHKWTGVTVFMLVLLRIVWRLTHSPPLFPATVSPFQARAAHLGHLLLYALLLAVPLSGWIMSSAKGFQTVWFGVLPLPDLIGKDPELGEKLEAVHAYLNYAFMATVAGHLLMALKHQFIDRDGTLGRMFYLK
jgi:cytochrome b561